MSIGKVFLWMLGILVGIVLLCLGAIHWDKHFPGGEYDERQKLVQGKAARFALLTGCVYFLVAMVILIGQVDGKKTVEPWLLVFFGVLLMLTVDHTYCFLLQAALPLSQKPMASIVSYGLLGITQLLFFFSETERFPLDWVGHGTLGWLHLLAGVDFLYLAVMHVLQYFRDRKE